MKTLSPLLILCIIFSLPSSLFAANYNSETGKKIYQQLSSPQRSAEDKARDANRKPVQTLEYFGLRDDMTVIELLPGSGWYTSLLAPVLAEKGKLYAAIGTERLLPLLQKQPALATQVELVGKVEGFSKTDLPGFIFDIGSVDLQVENADLVLTFRNLHNLSTAARKAVNTAVFKALKPGGIYGIIDHSRRHMEALSEANWRRTDPVPVIKELLDAGFEFVDYSDLHAIAADPLTHDTRHESVNTNSDRFTLKFRKPL